MNIQGERFGSSVVLSESGRDSSGKIVWLCACDCGAEFKTTGTNLRTGRVKSCRECSLARVAGAATTHGLTETPEYWVLVGIKDRCLNKNNNRYERYGGRGIKVCDRWLESVEHFVSDMGPRPSSKHSIERIDIDGNYEPGNCVWATLEQQAKNRSNNTQITINGVTKNIQQWSADTGVCRTVILKRMRRGLSGEDLIKKHQRTLITVGVVTDTISGWSRRTGIKPATIASRIRDYGWTHERAVTEGAAQ